MNSHVIYYSFIASSDTFKLSSEIELNSLSQFLVSTTEGKNIMMINIFLTMHMLLVKKRSSI